MYDDSDMNPFGRGPLRARDNLGRAVFADCTNGEIDCRAAATTSTDDSEFGDLRPVQRSVRSTVSKQPFQQADLFLR